MHGLGPDCPLRGAPTRPATGPTVSKIDGSFLFQNSPRPHGVPKHTSSARFAAALGCFETLHIPTPNVNGLFGGHTRGVCGAGERARVEEQCRSAFTGLSVYWAHSICIGAPPVLQSNDHEADQCGSMRHSCFPLNSIEYPLPSRFNLLKGHLWLAKLPAEPARDEHSPPMNGIQK